MGIELTIWSEVAKGNTEAYSRLYRYLFERLYNYGAKFTTDANILEDAVQEAMLLVWYKRDVLETIRYPQTYFFSVFRNNLLARLKSESDRTIDSEVREPDFNRVEILIKNEENLQLLERLKESMNKLTAHQKEVIYLRFYEGFSYDKVASILGITTKATYKAVARALERLERNMLISLAVAMWLLAW